MATFPFPYCVPDTLRGDVKFLPCWPSKKNVLGFFFCLKAIEVLGSDQCEFHVTGFTVLGIIVVFPLAGAGARLHPALLKDHLRKNTHLDEMAHFINVQHDSLGESWTKGFTSRHCLPFRGKDRLTTS